jgi:hypothetical protein
LSQILRAVVGNFVSRFLESRFQITNAFLDTDSLILFVIESGTKGQGITAVPGIIDERVYDAAHARQPVLA